MRDPQEWVRTMAEELVREITEQMAGIRLSPIADPGQEMEGRRIAGVCALIGGDYTFAVHFFAEKSLLRRFAQRMMGREPTREDIQDYAVEYFNTLCGRFISEIVNETHVRANFLPIEYKVPVEWHSVERDESMQTLFFVSEEKEYTAFSWTSLPIETMLRRNCQNMDKHKIMVVDDSRVVYAEMSKMLQDTEIEIAAFCRSGEEALEQYEAVKPELVTMDIVMPGMDGLEACKAMIERWPDAKIFMVSSMAYEDMIDNAAALGAKGFLFKPFTKETLLQGLRGALKTIAKQ